MATPQSDDRASHPSGAAAGATVSNTAPTPLTRAGAPPLGGFGTQVLTTRRLLGISLMIGAILCFSLLDTTAKVLSDIALLPVLMIIWMRFAVNVALNVVMLGPQRLPALMETSKPLLQILRSIFMMGATMFNFFAVSYLQLDQTITIFLLAPLIVAGLAGPLLGEWVGWRRMLAIIVGFAGVILVMRPGVGGVHWAIGLSFGAAACYALLNLCTRYMARHDPPDVTTFYTPLAGFVITTPFAFLVWETPDVWWHWVGLVSLGISGGIGHWLLVHAYRFAPAPTLAPFVYTGLLWMIILGYLIFGDVPDLWTLAGGAVIVGSGLYLLYRESQLRDVDVDAGKS